MESAQHTDTRALIRQCVAMVAEGPRHPEKPFIESNQTFSDIYALAAELKASWSALELKNGVIGVFTDNKALIAASLIAALGSDIVLTLPHAFSAQAFEQILASVDLVAAITDSPGDLPPNVLPLVPDVLNPTAAYVPPETPIDLDRAIVSFYTGGSTGKPRKWLKSVMNIFSEAVTITRKFHIRPEDRFLSTVPPNHIYGFLFSVLTPLVASSSVSNEVLTFPHTILSGIKEQASTILVSVPMHYRILNGYDIPSSKLRLAFSSAGALDSEDGLSFSRRTGAPVVEVYGSTETGGIATRSRFEGEESFTPFDVVDWHIENETLWVRSNNISPWVETDARGYFKIGDRVALRGTATFDVLGRSDGIVKVGGKRVDLDGIREIIKKMDGVHDAIVVSFPASPGRENIIAALIAGGVDRRQVMQALTGSMEPHALPRIIRIVDALPITATGKYDKTSIEQMLMAGPHDP